jgi:hypothetical protein
LLQVVDAYIAGEPQSEKRWTYLNRREIAEQLLKQGFQVGKRIIKRLLRQQKMGKRKIAKVQIMKTVAGRNEQFENIAQLQKEYIAQGYAVLSMDVKKKEYLGNLFRAGSTYGQAAQTSYDHDYSSFATGRLVPHGIYDLQHRQGYLTLGISADTAEFSTDCLKAWWLDYGQHQYEKTNPILLLCDGGGSNGSRNRLFKEGLQKLANELDITIRIAHYPPYCSKYNPIEHRFFPFITRFWQGVKLDCLQTAQQLIEQRSPMVEKIKISVHVIQQPYLKGKKVAKDFLQDCNIVFDQLLGKWNYVIKPQT